MLYPGTVQQYTYSDMDTVQYSTVDTVPVVVSYSYVQYGYSTVQYCSTAYLYTVATVLYNRVEF